MPLYFFYFVSVSLFRQCAVPLYLYFFLCACVSILPMFYASSFIFFFSLVPVALVLPMFYASLFVFFFSFVSEFWFCQCSMPLY